MVVFGGGSRCHGGNFPVTMQPTMVGCSLHADPQRSSLSLLTHIYPRCCCCCCSTNPSLSSSLQQQSLQQQLEYRPVYTLHYWWRFCLQCRLSVCLSVCMFVSKRIQTVIGGTLFHTRLLRHHHHHLFAQINWTRRRTHDQHENKSRTRKTQKTGAYILPIKTKNQTHSI